MRYIFTIVTLALISFAAAAAPAGENVEEYGCPINSKCDDHVRVAMTFTSWVGVIRSIC